ADAIDYELRCYAAGREEDVAGRIAVIDSAQRLRRGMSQRDTVQIQVEWPDGVDTAWQAHGGFREVQFTIRQLQMQLNVLSLRQRIAALVIVDEDKPAMSV